VLQVIGVDIGGTNLLVGKIVDGKVTERVHQSVAATGDFERVATQVCELIQSISPEGTDSVGISVAGSVDANEGIVLRAQNLNWDHAPLANFVSQRIKCNVVIENDVTSAAWGEFNYGAGIGKNSIFAVWIGTGIGGGLILDNKIWRGPLGTGGEFGMGISEFNPIAKFRVLESIASRSGLQNILGNPQLDTEMISSEYGVDSKLTSAVNDGGRRIGTAIANAITLLSLDTVVLGGGLIESLGAPFISVIREQFEADVFPPHCKQCQFKATELGPDAGLLGAALLAT